MTLTTLTLAVALSATYAQVPPAPAAPAPPATPAPATAPVVPAPPQTLLPPVLPAIPDMPDMPMLPLDFDMPEFDLSGLAALPFATETAVEQAMMAAETAMAAMPVISPMSFDGHALAAELEAARAGVAGFDSLAWGSQDGERERAAYERARAALDSRDWDAAVERFDRVVTMKGDRADAALYWKAYALNRAGKAAEAQAAIAALRSGYAKSRYLNDANALEVELKRGAGQSVSPESQQDEDLKLLALQGLQHSDPEQAIPLLEKILASSNSPRVKERALYVLALSNSPRAQEVLLGIAKGGSNPDLQRKAIDYLAMNSRRGGRSVLDEVYNATTDPEVRQRVLRAYMTSGDKAKLLSLAQSETNPEVRIAAIRYLGATGASAELSTLYTKESTLEGKRAIIRSLRAHDNAEALVAIARRETNSEIKEYAVRQLSTMTKNKVALDYLMELLNK